MCLTIELNFRSHLPLQGQVVEQIRRGLASGELRTGERLPPARQLAQALGINHTTVARAYRQLDEEGLLSTQQGRGAYILPGSGPERVEPYAAFGLDRLIELTEAYVLQARRAGFEEGAILGAVKRALEERSE
jgi:GntR family transcriptional regulator